MKKMEYPVEAGLTINVDASFHHQSKTGGYGIWISHHGGKIKKWGKFQDEINDANEAEIKGLVIALHYIKKLNNIKCVIINCDNSVVGDIIIKKKIPSKFINEANMLLEYLSEYPKVVSLNIQGHSKDMTKARNWVNDWCDKKSREYRYDPITGRKLPLFRKDGHLLTEKSC